MATFRKKPWGWEVQIRLRGRPSISGTYRLKADAMAWAAQVESEIVRGIYRERSQDDRYTLAHLLDRYRIEITPAKKSSASELHRIEALRQAAFAQIRLSEFLPSDLARWRDERLCVVSGSTVNRELNLISHVFSIARKEWGVSLENPVGRIRRPKNNRARARRLSISEEHALLLALEPSQRAEAGTFRAGGCRNPLMRPLVLLALETAMRRGELLSLAWDDVCLADCYARLRDSKNGDGRDVPLSRKAHAILSAMVGPHAGYVFPLSTEAVKQSFERACIRAGLVDFHFHDLRHEATTRLSRRLDNVLELSAVTGHRTLAMLKRYYHPHATDLAKKLG